MNSQSKQYFVLNKSKIIQHNPKIVLCTTPFGLKRNWSSGGSRNSQTRGMPTPRGRAMPKMGRVLAPRLNPPIWTTVKGSRLYLCENIVSLLTCKLVWGALFRSKQHFLDNNPEHWTGNRRQLQLKKVQRQTNVHTHIFSNNTVNFLCELDVGIYLHLRSILTLIFSQVAKFRQCYAWFQGDAIIPN